MTNFSEHALVSPKSQFLAVVRFVGDEVTFIHLPRWFTSSLELGHQFPQKISAGPTHPLTPLETLARDLRVLRYPLHDYLVEFVASNGDPLDVLVQGQFQEKKQPEGDEVVFSLRDVTEIVRSRRRASAIGAFHGLIGQSLPMLELYQKVALYGPTDAPVLITGETGTGKELIARALHERSERAQEPFVAVNCSALTSELFESELFGHEKGSFTGAHRQHRGRFERADKGTMFLDEIGDMPAMSQAKMLRSLEEGVIERVGGEGERSVDVRIVAATNVALEHAVQTRQFRPDLYHRISVLRLHVPPLREREGDLPLLVNHFLEFFNRRYQKQIRRVTPEALKMLGEYHWPGNIRELRNVMERLVIEVQGEAISARSLVQWLNEREFLIPGSWNADGVFQSAPTVYAGGGVGASVPAAPAAFPDPPRAGDVFWGAKDISQVIENDLISSSEIVEATPLPPDPIEGIEPEPLELTTKLIEDAYAKARGNLTKAARQLGIHKATLYRHMKRLELTREDLNEAMRRSPHE
jgi:two-component system, NtrC family, response regulator HydG